MKFLTSTSGMGMEIYVSSSNNANFEPSVDAHRSVFTGRHGHVKTLYPCPVFGQRLRIKTSLSVFLSRHVRNVSCLQTFSSRIIWLTETHRRYLTVHNNGSPTVNRICKNKTMTRALMKVSQHSAIRYPGLTSVLEPPQT